MTWTLFTQIALLMVIGAILGGYLIDAWRSKAPKP